ncbi:MAG: hypothetical protein R6X02_31230 [Enhygromyxa sp.]
MLAVHAVLAALLATCPEFPADPTVLVPDSTSAVLGVDVDAFAQTSTGKAVLPALGADLQIADALEIIDDCGLALDRTYALVLARDPGDGRMLAVQARGLGEAATLECLAAELRARSEGVEPWTRERTGCFDSLALGDGSRIWIGNSFTLVWATGSFVEPVAAKLGGAVPLGLPQSLADEFARLDRSGHLWLAARLEEHDRQALASGWSREVESLTVALDLSKGLRAVVSLSAATVTALAGTRERLLASFASLAARLDEYGVEHRLRERARVGIVAGVVAAELELDEGELRAIRTRIGEQVVGRGPL